MIRQSVNSTSIVSIGYDENSQTLEIEFKNSNVYQYFDVPKNLYDDLISAPSQGQFLTQNIKGNYRYSKV